MTTTKTLTNTLTTASGEGLRLARATPARTAIVSVVVAAAVVTPVVIWPLTPAALIAAITVALVARRSPHPIREEVADAWSRAGAGRLGPWLVASVEALAAAGLGIIGGVIVAALLALTVPGIDLPVGEWAAYVIWLAVGLTVVSLLPARREAPPRAARRRLAREATVALGALYCAAALGLTVLWVLGIDSDLGLSIGGFVGIVLVATAIAVVTGPAVPALSGVATRTAQLRPLAAIAAPRRIPATVRVVAAGAIVFAMVMSILGASVEARPDTEAAVRAYQATLPNLPPNVAVISLTGPRPYDAPEAWNAAEIDPAIREAVRAAVPDAEVIEVQSLYPRDRVPRSVLGPRANDVVASDPRLGAVFGEPADYRLDRFRETWRAIESLCAFSAPTAPGIPAPECDPLPAASLPIPDTGGEAQYLDQVERDARTRIPTFRELVRKQAAGRPLPPAKFDQLRLFEVPASSVLATNADARVQRVIVRADAPLSDEQVDRLTAATRAAAPPEGLSVSVVRSVPGTPPEYSRGTEPKPLRDQPWAATAPQSRWWWAFAVGAFAVGVLLATLALMTIDRRRAVARIERLGATPGQVRAAAALQAGIFLTVTATLSAAVVAVLVWAGTNAYSDRHPEIPIPFVMPWAVVAFLAVAVPLVGAALAALVARPPRTALEARM